MSEKKILCICLGNNVHALGHVVKRFRLLVVYCYAIYLFAALSDLKTLFNVQTFEVCYTLDIFQICCVFCSSIISSCG